MIQLVSNKLLRYEAAVCRKRRLRKTSELGRYQQQRKAAINNS